MQKNAQNTLAEIISKDKNNFRMLQKRLIDMDNADAFPMPRQKATISKALSDLNKGKVTKSVYDAANMALIKRDALSDTDAFRKNFYDALTNKGYNGIIDVNDKKFSGYNSKSPMIAFNAGKKLVTNSVTKMSGEELTKSGMIEYGKLYGKQMAKKLIAIVGGSVAISKLTESVGNTKNRDKIVNDYKKEHPETKLSYNEILENYYKK